MRLPGVGVAIALTILCLGASHAVRAQSTDQPDQSGDQSAAPIQGQALAPPPNTDPSRILGAGADTAPAMPAPAIPLPNAPGLGAAAPPLAAPALWLPKTATRLTVLDKIYGTSSQLSATVGTPFKVRFLTVTVLACWVRPDSLPSDAAVFLDVADSRAPAGAPPEFRGWIFKAEPALSGLSDPVTDISVDSCG